MLHINVYQKKAVAHLKEQDVETYENYQAQHTQLKTMRPQNASCVQKISLIF
jgi:hypothetical protein